MDIVKVNDLVLLVDTNHKQMIFRIQDGKDHQTHRGAIHPEDIIGKPYGSSLSTHIGDRFYFFRPTLRDILLNTVRRSQIIFPKDIGYILLRLSAGPGLRIIEAGTGSGALTTALAWAVGDTGRVYSYDKRIDLQKVAIRNLEANDLQNRVDFYHQDIAEGFRETDVDAVFLDVAEPHLYLDQVRAALVNGGVLGVILPTTPQVSLLLTELKRHSFLVRDVCEIMLRFYKPIPARLRPMDRMVAHTGYLIFAHLREINPDEQHAAVEIATVSLKGAEDETHSPTTSQTSR